MSNKKIIISDTTLCYADDHCSFKEKIDIIKKLDALGVDIIELPAIENERADTLLLHTVSPLLKNASIFCDAGFSEASLLLAWNAVKTCKKPGITVALPVSTVQMEFICHKKAPAMLTLAETLITKAASFGCCVEFKAIDASRAEKTFLEEIVTRASECGADIITICDSTGTLLPGEVEDVIRPAEYGKTVGISCSNAMAVSTANAFSAISAGATLVKTTCYGNESSDLLEITNVLKTRGADLIGAECSVNYPILGRTVSEIKSIFETKRSELSPFDNGVEDSDGGSIKITTESSIESIISMAASLGYDLSDQDAEKVYENVQRLTEKKPIGKREFEAVIATSAMQIPSTYIIKSYVINSGNVITATAHIELEKQGKIISGISTGDGPIDAAFLSIEQITGRHYELDDFQIRSITEGREAVGEALVKIRNNGKLYSGRGVSTDIIGASIRAYVIALNKICYEENNR